MAMNIFGTILVGRHRRDDSGFTMVEIAICLAIIGIALVAIIGVLPIGMSTQRENRERTVINQDATVFMELIRNGSRGADDLTNYVYAITNYWTIYSGGSTVKNGVNGYTYAGSSTTPSFPINSGARVIGLLSTPEYANPTNYASLGSIVGGSYVSNRVVAYVHSMSGPAVEKPPQDNLILQQDSFSYRIVLGNLSVQIQNNGSSAYAAALQANLHELRLTFLWPLLPNGKLPSLPPHLTFRTMVAGQFSQTNDNSQMLYFFQPQSFNNNSTTNAP